MNFSKKLISFTFLGAWLYLKFSFLIFAADFGGLQTSVEYLNYISNAVILAFIFAYFEKDIETRIGKALGALVVSAVFVGQIIVENYFFAYLQCLTRWDYCSVEEIGLIGLNRYLKYGYPGYHWAFLGMILICIVILFLRASKPKIKMAIKDILFKKAEKTLKSVYFTILFEGFLDCINVGEYLCLKDWYLFSDIKWSIISREFEESDWEEMDSFIFDPINEYFEQQEKNKKAHAEETSEEETSEVETSEVETKTEEIDDNSKASDDISAVEESE